MRNAKTISLKTTGLIVQSVLSMKLAFLLNVLHVTRRKLYKSMKMNLICLKFVTMMRLKTVSFKLDNIAINAKMDSTLMVKLA